MSIDFHSRRFDPRWLSPASEKCEQESFEGLDALLRSLYEDLRSAAPGRDFDVALEQIASDGLHVCALCGAIVTSDGTVVSDGPFGGSRDF
jgi:hypothetical protein